MVDEAAAVGTLGVAPGLGRPVEGDPPLRRQPRAPLHLDAEADGGHRWAGGRRRPDIYKYFRHVTGLPLARMDSRDDATAVVTDAGAGGHTPEIPTTHEVDAEDIAVSI